MFSSPYVIEAFLVLKFQSLLLDYVFIEGKIMYHLSLSPALELDIY